MICGQGGAEWTIAMDILNISRYKKRLPYLACFSAALFSFYNLLQISVFNVISVNLLATFHLSYTQLGLISAVYLLANMMGIIPGGILIDTYSPRLIALLMSALDISASFVIAESSWLSLIILMRFFQGLASAISLLTCTRFAARWFPAQAGTAVGFMVAFALLGGVFANTLFAKMAIVWGWRHAMLFNGAIGTLYFLFMLFFLQDKSTKLAIDAPKEGRRKASFTVKKIIVNSNIITQGIYIGLMNLPIFLFATLWGMLYLKQAYQIAVAQSSFICSLLYAGLFLGAPTLGFVSDKIHSRKKILIASSLLILICVLPLLTGKNLTAPILAVIFFWLGFFSSSPIVSYAALAESAPIYNMSTINSISFFIANFIGMIAQPAFAYLLNVNWHPVYINGIPFYSLDHYRNGVKLLLGAFIVCLIFSFLMKERNNNFDSNL